MMNRDTAERAAAARASLSEGAEERIFEAIRQAIKQTQYGSVEVIIHDSRVVQIERKEKTRFDRQ